MIKKLLVTIVIHLYINLQNKKILVNGKELIEKI